MRCLKLARVIAYVGAPLLVAGVLGWEYLPRLAVGGTPEELPGTPASQPVQSLPADEWNRACKEFETITDSTIECGAEEMPAYWRLLKWVVRYSANDSQRAAAARVSYRDLVNMPNRLRGKLIQVDLHVCRVLAYDAPQNSLGISRLYEVWGWSEDSRGSLYVVVTPDLPPGIGTGEVVQGRAALVGYFCKIQGYLAVGSTPQACPSAAPLIMGRLVPYEAPVQVIARPSEVWRAGAGLLLAVSFVGIISRRPLFRRRRGKSIEELGLSDTASLDAWLDHETENSVAADEVGQVA